MTMKKVTSMVLAGLLAINVFGVGTGATGMSYAEELTVDQKASVLNKMSLLAGDGTSFQLNQKLKRSEAAAFMVKALGMQQTVMTNAASYTTTGFKDVPATEWYAAYVGYCVKNGIITGYPDGKFKPNENLSEKAFYSMLLKALGYTSGDYDWNTVYKKALDVGISKNMLIAFNTEDNLNFLRAGVVESLYLAMPIKHKGSEKVFVENLINNNVVSKELASQNGFIKVDLLKTQLLATKLVDSKTIELTFNEALQPVVPGVVKVYKYGAANSPLTVTDVATAGTKVTVKTADPIPSQRYTVEVGQVADLENNPASGFLGDYTTAAQVEVKSPYFKIAKVDVVNLKTLQVTFTHPITDKAETELLYTILQNGTAWSEGGFKTMTVRRSQEKNTVVQINLLTQTLVEGQKYDLKIRGDLESGYKMKLNNGDGETTSFVAQAGQTAALAQLANVYSQENKYVYVDLTQKVDQVSAANKANYVLKEIETNRLLTPTTVFLTKSTDRFGKQVVLRFDGMISTKNYELTVKNLYSEYQAAKVPDLVGTFVSGAVATQELAVEHVHAVDKFTVNVYFNREMSAQAAFGSYLIDNGLIIAKKTLDPVEPRLIRLHLNASTPLKTGLVYKLLVYPGIQDYTERTFAATVTKEFAGIDTAKQNMLAESATFIGTDTILARFSQKLDATANTVSDKFEIYHSDGKNERLILPEVIFVSGDGVVILKLPLLMAGGTYTLKAKNVIDESGFTTTTMNAMPITNEFYK